MIPEPAQPVEATQLRTAALGSESPRTLALPKDRLRRLYDQTTPADEARSILASLGPAGAVFAPFLEHERTLRPALDADLAALFDACCDSGRSTAELLGILRRLAPGAPGVGIKQVLFLVERLRARTAAYLEREVGSFDLRPHDHAFGSGGDFRKTAHATTAASLVVAPLHPVFKTGTNHVTSEHGSAQAAEQLGYARARFEPATTNAELECSGFSFVSLASLGFPYSESLRAARRALWEDARCALERAFLRSGEPWPDVVRRTPIPLDVFKIISPNAQVFSPRRHSTGVCHASMLPYVLGIYLHLHSEGIIVHGYDGIDEFSTAGDDPGSNAPNNLVVKVETDRVLVAELGPEDLGFARVSFDAIRENGHLSHEIHALRRILSGEERGPLRDFVVANAAALLCAASPMGGTADLGAAIHACARRAEDAIDSGAVESCFRRRAGAPAPPQGQRMGRT